jgi:hypothetical protein
MTSAVIKHLRRLSKAEARERATAGRSYYGDELRKLLDAKTAAIMGGDFAEADRLDGEIVAFEERHKRIVRPGEIAPGTATEQ